jgi:hypothetical protein
MAALEASVAAAKRARKRHQTAKAKQAYGHTCREAQTRAQNRLTGSRYRMLTWCLRMPTSGIRSVIQRSFH